MTRPSRAQISCYADSACVHCSLLFCPQSLDPCGHVTQNHLPQKNTIPPIKCRHRGSSTTHLVRQRDNMWRRTIRTRTGPGSRSRKTQRRREASLDLWEARPTGACLLPCWKSRWKNITNSHKKFEFKLVCLV